MDDARLKDERPDLRTGDGQRGTDGQGTWTDGQDGSTEGTPRLGFAARRNRPREVEQPCNL